MIEKNARRVTNLLVEEHIIQKKSRDMYQYGMELLISTLLNLVVVLIIGALFGAPLQGLCYFLLLATVRTQAGGYHASSYCRCGLIYCATFCASLLFVHIFLLLDINSAFLIVALLTSTYFIWRLAPVLHNRVMSEAERKCTKKKTGIRCLVWIIIAQCLFQTHRAEAYSILATFILIIAFMLVGRKMEEKSEKRHKEKDVN